MRAAEEPGANAVQVRRISPEDAAGWRALRLAALAEEPIAFARSVEEDAALPMEVWRQRAVAGAAGSQAAVFLALAWVRPVGMIMGADAGQGSTKILSMYVAPPNRGSGLVDRLLAAVAAWSREADRHELVLEVSDVARALAAYARHGFRATGHGSSHPLFAQVTLIEMRMTLPG